MTMRKTTPASVDAYIAAFPPKVRTVLRKVRATIRKAAPDAEETISYRIPCFTQGGVLVYFAAFKAHIGLFPPVRGDARLVKAASRYAGPKGNLRFPLDEPIPYDLIARIVKFRMRQFVRTPDTKRRTARRRVAARTARPIGFAAIRQIGLRLPGVEEATSYGTPALKVKGKFFLRLREDGETIALRMSFADRDVLMQMDPDTFFITDHYRDWPAVLVNLTRATRPVLKDAMLQGWRVAAPTSVRKLLP